MKRLATAAALSLLCLSCATVAVTDKGWEEHEEYWSITQVLRARVSGDELWLLLELKRERSNFRKVAALSIPMEKSTWLLDREGKLTCPEAVPWKEARHVSPRSSVLRDSGEFPEAGQEIEIQNLVLSDPKELNALEPKGDPWTVVFVQFKPEGFGEHNKQETIPVLALVRASSPGEESEKCVLYSFFVGITHNEGWVLLAPFAMAFDAVTLPIQLLGLLWWLTFGE